MSCPLKVLAASGTKFTPNARLFPGLAVFGDQPVTNWNSEGESVMLSTVRLVVPVFVRMKVVV